MKMLFVFFAVRPTFNLFNFHMDHNEEGETNCRLEDDKVIKNEVGVSVRPCLHLVTE